MPAAQAPLKLLIRLALRLAPALPWWLITMFYGGLLWVFALYIMAHFIASNPPFLNFTGITWVALVGHVLFALMAPAIVDWRERR